MVTNKELINLIKGLKDDPTFGGGDFDFEKSWNKFADQYGFQKYSGSQYKISWREYLNYFLHVGLKTFVRPVGFALSAFVLAFAGWVTTVNVSLASVPGDFLYPVKMVTERMQLTLASNDEQRARLHTEFASRRLDEVMEITTSSRTGKDVRVQEAVDSFKQSISSANQAVQNLVSSSPEAAASVAIAIDQKVEAMASALSENSSESVSQTQNEQMVDAQNTAEASTQFLTETIVSSNEAIQQNNTDEYLQSTFKQDMTEIQERSTNLLSRIEKIEVVMVAGRAPYDYSKNVIVIKDLTSSVNGKLEEAMVYFAAGGWRRVLETITDLKTKLSNAETLAGQMEIEISTKDSQPL